MKDKWISVKDELPESCQVVSIKGFEGIHNMKPFEEEDFYRNDRSKWNSQMYCNTKYVTHWKMIIK